jgi:hypothetical protein
MEVQPTNHFCKNCGTSLQGPFCHACGQEYITERFTVRSLLTGFVANIFNIEKGFFHTTLELIRRPEKVLADYLDRNTIHYYHPVRFAVVWLAISVILTLYFGIYDGMMEQVLETYRNMGLVDSPETELRMRTTMDYMKNFLNIVPFFVIPFNSLFSWKMLHKRPLNYAEHLVMNTYLMGLATCIGMIPLAVYILIPQTVSWSFMISFALFMILYILVGKRFFQYSTIGALIRGIFIPILGYALFFTLSMLSGIVVALLITLIS